MNRARSYLRYLVPHSQQDDHIAQADKPQLRPVRVEQEIILRSTGFGEIHVHVGTG